MTHITDYIKNRIEVNNKLLLSIKDPKSIIMIENAITELEGVLEIAEWKQSLTSKEVKICHEK